MPAVGHGAAMAVDSVLNRPDGDVPPGPSAEVQPDLSGWPPGPRALGPPVRERHTRPTRRPGAQPRLAGAPSGACPEAHRLPSHQSLTVTSEPLTAR